MDNYQPNTDTSHDHTYPEQPEGLRRFEALISNDVDLTPWPARAERRMAALEANAAEQARLIEELRRYCTDLVIRVAVLEQGKAQRENQSGARSVAAEVTADAAASAILAYMDRQGSAVAALDTLRCATPNAVFVTLSQADGGIKFSAEEIFAGYYRLLRRLEAEVISNDK